MADSNQHAADSTLLVSANTALNDQKAQIQLLNGLVTSLQTELSQAKTELSQETRTSSSTIAGQAAANAEVLEKEQNLTFDSLLANASEPAHGFVEFKLANPVIARPSHFLQGRAFFCEQWLTNWQVIEAFRPFANLIDCAGSWPIQFTASLGVFRNDQNESYSWTGQASTINKQKVHNLEGLDNATFLVPTGSSSLIMRLPTFEKPNLSDLWRGPTVNHPSAKIQVMMVGLDALSKDERNKLDEEAARLIDSVTIYYAVSSRADLCKSMKLKSTRVPRLDSDGIDFEFKGSEKIESAICPDYASHNDYWLLNNLN
jgi:hypothetical protein